MIKLLYSLRRRSDLSRRAFQEHWLGYHCPHFGLRNEPASIYVVYPALPMIPADLVPWSGGEYDGVAVVWFDGVEGVRASMESELVAVAAEDERLFIDHDLSIAVLAQEYVVIEPRREAPVVLFEHVRRAPGCSSAEFARRWCDADAPVHEAYARGLVAGHVQNVVIPSGIDAGLGALNDLGGNRETWDGIATTYFDSELLARRYLEDVELVRRRTDNGLLASAATVRTLTSRRVFRHLVR